MRFRASDSLGLDIIVDFLYGMISSNSRSKSHLANFCEHYSFISNLEPMKAEGALDGPDWVNAMHEELHNYERNQVWTLVEKPDNNHNIIGTKWVFRNKQDEDGQVVRNKARLVAQGYTQVEGMDYGETYAPVVGVKTGGSRVGGPDLCV